MAYDFSKLVLNKLGKIVKIRNGALVPMVNDDEPENIKGLYRSETTTDVFRFLVPPALEKLKDQIGPAADYLYLYIDSNDLNTCNMYVGFGSDTEYTLFEDTMKTPFEWDGHIVHSSTWFDFISDLDKIENQVIITDKEIHSQMTPGKFNSNLFKIDESTVKKYTNNISFSDVFVEYSNDLPSWWKFDLENLQAYRYGIGYDFTGSKQAYALIKDGDTYKLDLGVVDNNKFVLEIKNNILCGTNTSRQEMRFWYKAKTENIKDLDGNPVF